MDDNNDHHELFRAKAEIAALLKLNLQQKVALEKESSKLYKRIHAQQQQLSWLGSKPRPFTCFSTDLPAKPDYIMVTEAMEKNIKERLHALKDLLINIPFTAIDVQTPKTATTWLSPFPSSCLTTPETQDDDSDKEIPTTFTEKVQWLNSELLAMFDELNNLVTHKMTLIEKLQQTASATAASIAHSSAVLEQNLDEKLHALLALIAVEDSSNTSSSNTSFKYACLNPLTIFSTSHNEGLGLEKNDLVPPEVQVQNVQTRCLKLLDETYQAMENRLEQERYGKSVIFFDQEAQITALNASLKANQEELTKSHNESTSVRELLAEVTADCHWFKEQHQVLLDQVAQQKSQLQRVNEIAECYYGELQELTSVHRYLLIDRDALQASLIAQAKLHEQEVEDLLDEIKTCRDQIEALTIENEKDAVKREKTRRELKHAVDDIAKFYQEIQRLRESIDQSATETNSLQRHLEGTNRELVSVRGQLAASIEAHQIDKIALFEERDVLQFAHNALENAKTLETRLRNELHVQSHDLLAKYPTLVHRSAYIIF